MESAICHILPATPIEPAEDAQAVLAQVDPRLALSRTIIGPPRGWQLVNVCELWRYRELLYFLTWRDVKVRYKQTLLGASWAILQPVMMMIVFTVSFGSVAKFPTGGLTYPIFVFTGLLPWTFFASAIANAGNSVVGSERLITKIYFPRLAIPFAAAGAALVDFAIAFAVLLLMMAWYHIPIGPQILLVPVLVLVLTLAALGVGTLLAALNVAYRDFRYVMPFMIQLWMFATPTVYMQSSTDDSLSGNTFFHHVISFNPITGLINTFRAVTLGSAVPWMQAAISTVVLVSVFILGCFYFRRVEDTFADLI